MSSDALECVFGILAVAGGVSAVRGNTRGAAVCAVALCILYALFKF